MPEMQTAPDEKRVTSINLSVVNVRWARGKCLNLSEYVDQYLTRERMKDATDERI